MNVVAAHVTTPPGCRVTEVFDITELDEEGEFSLEGNGVLRIEVVTQGPELGTEEAGEGIQVCPMDATHSDDDWTLCPELVESEAELDEGLAVARVSVVSAGAEVDVIIDFGADISVAPLRLGNLGTASTASGFQMQDAQGKGIKECGSRVIDIAAKTLEGCEVILREKFAIAKIESVILSLGRLLRWGWQLGCFEGKPTIERGGHVVPIRLRRNTLLITARLCHCQRRPSQRPRAGP